METLFGEYFKQLREGAGLSLRSFCAANGFDPGNISRLERGSFLAPGSQEKLREYAKALGIKEGSTEWIEFFDKAAASRGMIPRDLHKEEDLVRRLPLLFRTIRGQKLPTEALDAVVELVRASDAHGE